MKVFHEMRGAPLEDIILAIGDPKTPSNCTLSEYYAAAMGQVIPIVQAFLKLIKTHQIPFHLINIQFDHFSMRRQQHEKSWQMMVQKSIHILLTTAYLECARFYRHDIEYICVRGINKYTHLERYAVALLDILEQRVGYGKRDVNIDHHMRLNKITNRADERAPAAAEQLSFAKRLYEAMTAPFARVDRAIKHDAFMRQNCLSDGVDVTRPKKFHVGILKVYTEAEMTFRSGHFRALERTGRTEQDDTSEDDVQCEEDDDNFTYSRRLPWSRGLTSREVLDHKAQNVAKSFQPE